MGNGEDGDTGRESLFKRGIQVEKGRGEGIYKSRRETCEGMWRVNMIKKKNVLYMNGNVIAKPSMCVMLTN